MPGQTTADKYKDSMLRSSGKTIVGKIRSIDMRDTNWEKGKEKKITPYASIMVDFPHGKSATVPCDISHANEYGIGDKVSISINFEEDDDDEE